MIDTKLKRKLEIRRGFVVDKSMNGNLIVCESENEIGKTTKNMTLNIMCKNEI